MSTAKFKMPTDKQIWAEVDAYLDAYPEVLKPIRKPPSREALFESKKSAYKNTPKRLAAEEKAKKDAISARAAADKAYIELRKSQGKPVITVKQFFEKYPKSELNAEKLSAQELHEHFDSLEQLLVAYGFRKKVARIEALSRSLLFSYLSKAYGLYRRINKSEVAVRTFREIRGLLWNDFKVKTHEDLPRASLLLKMVFEKTDDKTIHLYSRSFLIADSYDIEEDGFVDFIKELGGLEKIRKAYATVIAADAGKIVPAHVKIAEESASIKAISSHEPYIVQMKNGQTLQYENDIFGRFCILLVRKAALDQLEVICQVPSTTAFENYLLKWIGDEAKDRRLSKWQKWEDDKEYARKIKVKEAIETSLDKAEKAIEKLAVKKKKEEALAKKNAAVAKRFAKQRMKSSETKVK